MQEQYREASDRFAALRNSLIDIIHEIDVIGGTEKRSK